MHAHSNDMNNTMNDVVMVIKNGAKKDGCIIIYDTLYY